MQFCVLSKGFCICIFSFMCVCVCSTSLTISGKGTSSWVPAGASTAKRVSSLKALQMSSCVTNL